MQQGMPLHSSNPNSGAPAPNKGPLMNVSSHPRSRVQQVREQLEDDIVNGRLAPGVQVDVGQLVVRFSV